MVDGPAAIRSIGAHPAWLPAAVLCLALASAWSDAAFGDAVAGKRVALVVGNAKYAHAPPLANPHNDAQDIAAALRGLGFTVELAVDLERSEFGSRVTAFAKQTRGADAALFFYAGHGLQVDGENYLLPVDAVLEDETQLPFHAVGLDAVLRGMRSNANLVFLDACRDNPFVRSVARSMGSRSSAVGRGLARVNRSAYRGVFVAFATAAGQTASDGDDRNSPFTAALKKHIAKPGLEINQVLNRTRRELANVDQEPWDTSSLKEDFFFVPRSEDAMVPVPPQVVGGAGPDPAAEAWRQISATTNPRLLERYIKDFPTSGYRWAAEARLDELKGQPFTVVVEPSAARVRILNIEPPYRAGMKLPAGEYRVEASAPDYASKTEMVQHGASGPTVHRVELEKLFAVGGRFRDCPECPEMVVVPAGSFRMGSPSHEEGRREDEGPVHRVRIGKPFAVGVYEVTVAEFGRFAEGTGHSTGNSCGTYEGDQWQPREGRGWRNPGFGQGGSHPVACVSWDDARAYASWLSRSTGERYRLLSESEWEYVARAGTTGPFHTGSTISTEQANYKGLFSYPPGGPGYYDPNGLYRKRTLPVGSFPANGFGLHDVHGNVWEWTGDCWNESYAGAPSDGSSWERGDCSHRVLRGGGSFDFPRILRSAFRGRNVTGFRSSGLGFRVARTLTP